MRKEPTQERSRRRVAAILQATVKLMMAYGYEATTTAMIAEEAGVPIGSLYQFFANKEAILEALARHYAADMLALRERLFPVDMVAIPLPTLVAQTADKLVAFLDEHRGFNHLLGSVWASTEIAAAFDQMRRDMIEGITAVILGKAPLLPAAEARPCAQTLLHLIMGILPMIETSNGADRVIAIRELKRAWLAYLTAVIEESATEGRRASAV